MNVVPSPIVLSMDMFLPESCTLFSALDKPSPMSRCFRVVRRKPGEIAQRCQASVHEGANSGILHHYLPIGPILSTK